MVQVRHDVTKLKLERQEMESMFCSAERMLNAAAEAAMLSGG